MAEAMRSSVGSMLRGIESIISISLVQIMYRIFRYNPENISTLERYVELQARENTYDLEANLALLKLYQFNPTSYKNPVTCIILLKALTNLPHTDFVLCKCLIGQEQMEEKDIKRIMYLHDLLEMCHFNIFWAEIDDYKDLECCYRYLYLNIQNIHKRNSGSVKVSADSLMKALHPHKNNNCRNSVLNSWMAKYNWKEEEEGYIMIGNQEETVKTKNITEKIDFESVAGIMAACR
ncbi:Eukaryotic translation initiation factor 3 subunit K [Armadillidium nasatum]|uniref:Eukaryotic translation initiation factor 3 subunit K n=1 Tax=Armadillidium nasatum TaxID=96803 RepID=A0A5N5TM82_9CRUS|nr:Eukaryotic translation initiation factor 3 subunit K [Armadillidium nasatum]